MGNNRYVLASGILPDCGLLSQRSVIECCESIHWHSGDGRTEWPLETYVLLAELFQNAASNLAEKGIKCSPTIFEELSRNDFHLPERRDFRIEELTNGIIHVHYRNYRVEMDRATFFVFARGINKALNHLLTLHPERVGPDSGRSYTEITLPISKINPYDGSHTKASNAKYGFQCKNLIQTKEHIHGIEMCISLIKQGYKMLPIAVSRMDITDKGLVDSSPRFQRLDGFKRFIAHRELGEKQIPCHLYSGDEAYPGNQRYLPWVVG